VVAVQAPFAASTTLSPPAAGPSNKLVEPKVCARADITSHAKPKAISKELTLITD
jgi:hypothetical protein